MKYPSIRVEDHKLKKSMTEDRDDKKLHPLGTFSHGGVGLGITLYGKFHLT